MRGKMNGHARSRTATRVTTLRSASAVATRNAEKSPPFHWSLRYLTAVLAKRLGLFWRRLASRIRQRHAERYFRELPDEILKDIGMVRTEAPRIAADVCDAPATPRIPPPRRGTRP